MSAKTSAERFLDLFGGSEVAHGKTIMGRETRSGKREAKSFVVREPLTLELVQKHLDGKDGVGAIPINTENKCRFAALDIDDYDLSIESLAKKIKDLEAPFVVCRSKSGGAHVYLFLKTFEPAVLVREYMTEISAALGFSGREIFPKQDTIMAEKGDVGNFINLPYFDAERGLRYAVDGAGEAITLEQFLNRAENSRCNLSDLETLTLRGQRTDEDLAEYPPCIRRIVAAGGFSVNRNISLFHAGVAVRKADPDNWEAVLDEFNTRFMVPPLPAKEVAILQNQHGKKDWGFKCNDQPMRDYCDKELCRQARYGIGGGGGSRMPALSGLTIVLSDPRMYYLNVDGKRIELDSQQLNSPKEFQLKCLEDIKFRPDVLKDRDWGVLVNKLLAEAVEIEVPPELTLEGQFTEHLTNYCTSRIRALDPVEVKTGKPWTDKGYHYFTISGLMDYLAREGFKRVNRAQAQNLIKKMNPDEVYQTHLGVKASTGSGRSTIRVWQVPEFKIDETEPEMEERNGEGSIPF